MPALHNLGRASLGLLVLAACGGAKAYTKRTIDTPAGERDTLGPPRNTAYAADVRAGVFPEAGHSAHADVAGMDV